MKNKKYKVIYNNEKLWGTHNWLDFLKNSSKLKTRKIYHNLQMFFPSLLNSNPTKCKNLYFYSWATLLHCDKYKKRKITYFHPSGVLQHSQYISATAWSPVSSTRSSAWPQATLTLLSNFGVISSVIYLFWIHLHWIK